MEPQSRRNLQVQTEERNAKPLIDPRRVALLLLRHWKELLACTCVGVGLGLLLSAVSPKIYTANASGVVLVKGSSDAGGALVGDNIAKSKATQYQSLAKSRTVAADALKIAQLKGNPDAEAAAVAVAVPLDTPQINISVSRSNPKDAAALANAWVEALSKSVNELAAETAPTSASGGMSQGSAITLRKYVPALAPQGPSSPNTLFNAILGGLVGIFVGVLWSFIRNRADRRIRGKEIIEKTYGLSVVGTLPKRDGDAGRAAMLNKVGSKASKANFHMIESYNALRANLQFINPDNPPRIIVITSPLPAEGKSTVAANLAITVAKSGRPVVLLDGDLRRPTVAKTFGLIPEVGVTTAVVSHGSPEDVLQEVQGSNIRVMTSGPTPPNPSEIVASDAFEEMCRELSETYLVIIDAPPLIPVADAAIMARRFDGCFIVLNAETATQDAFDQALSVLDKVDADVLGVVLNKVPTSRLEGSQYGYYGDYAYYGSETGEGERRRLSESPEDRPAGAVPASSPNVSAGAPDAQAVGRAEAEAPALPPRRRRRTHLAGGSEPAE